MTVWVLSYSPEHESGHVIGVYATEELAQESRRRLVTDDPYNFTVDEFVIKGLPS